MPIVNEQKTQKNQKVSEQKTDVKTDNLEQVFKQAHQQLASLPDVDMDSVNAMKAAIKKGDVSVDINRLADAMQAFFRGNDE